MNILYQISRDYRAEVARSRLVKGPMPDDISEEVWHIGVVYLFGREGLFNRFKRGEKGLHNRDSYA